MSGKNKTDVTFLSWDEAVAQEDWCGVIIGQDHCATPEDVEDVLSGYLDHERPRYGVKAKKISYKCFNVYDVLMDHIYDSDFEALVEEGLPVHIKKQCDDLQRSVDDLNLHVFIPIEFCHRAVFVFLPDQSEVSK